MTLLLNFLATTETELSFDVPTWAWVAFAVFIAVMLALDLGIAHRRDATVPLSSAAIWSAIWIALAAIACALIALWHGREVAELFATGYLLELSLSVDNLFVFMLVFVYFAVPEKYQHRALFWGIIGAVIFRTIFILGGVALVERFSWMMFVFSILLLYTGLRMLFHGPSKTNFEKNIAVRLFRKTGRLAPTYDNHFFWFRDTAGKILLSPLLLVVIVVELSDIMFAVDSVPAVIGVIPKDAAAEVSMFIAITSNVFAILGLRSLFFVLSHFMRKTKFLRYGLGIVLIFVGVKFFCDEADWWHASTRFSLIFLLVVLAISAILSIIFPQKIQKKPELFNAMAFFRKKKSTVADVAKKLAESEPLPNATPEVPSDKSKPWIGVDLDGTLAEWTSWKGLDHIGKPIPLMLARVKYWLENGITVKIVTARASDEENGLPPVKAWLKKHGLPDLEVTNKKDFDMIELWDDRAIQVIQNSGKPFLSMFSTGRPAAPILPNEDSSSTFYLLKKPAKPKSSTEGESV